ncbi:MFS transporter [Microbacterium sp. NPDC079995]|uniref:MFS transporter n=1 Tax=unclassified Microbacterium TaxID=2609290 RepID=UPI00344E2D4F
MTGTIARATTGGVLAVAGVYGLQGLGYAVIVTALPAFQERTGLDATGIAVILLGVCVTAALGSLAADVIARRASSRHGVIVGLSLQAAGLVATAFSPGTAALAASVLLYGLGLGLIDASSNMQGVLVQRGRGTPLLGRFFATLTTGSIVGALGMAGILTAGAPAFAALVAAAVLQVVFVVAFSRLLSRQRAARSTEWSGPRRPRLDGRAITVVGLVILAAYTVDSAVSSWSSVHLLAIGAAGALAPVGLAAYQGGVLAARLATDAVVRRLGRGRLLAAGLLLGVVGAIVVAAVPSPVVSIAAFAVSGLAVGALVPIAFGLAGAIDPARSDEVIARVNLFNYAGAVLGAVGVGVLTDVTGSGLAFLLPALLLVAAVPAWRRTAA